MWYVIWTITGKEEVLEEELKKVLPKKLYRKCWTPKKLERQKWNGKYEDMEKVLFPGYLLLDTDCPVDIHEYLKKTRKFTIMHALLRNEDTFMPISRQEEQILRRLTGDGSCIDISVGNIRRGELHILQGALCGMEEYIVKIDRHKRKAYLEMELFGRIQKWSAGLEIIEKN